MTSAPANSMHQRLRPTHPVVLLAAGVLSLFVGCAASPAKSSDSAEAATDVPMVEADERGAILEAMRTELERSSESLRIEDYEPPYFIAYQIKDTREITISGKFGALTNHDRTRHRRAYVEVRVGDYKFDNFANVDTQNFRMGGYSPSRTIPLGTDRSSIRSSLWLLTDHAYKTALSNFLAKKGGAVFQTDEKSDVGSFSRAPTSTYRGPPKPLKVDRDAWRRRVESLTSRMLEFDELIDANVTFSAKRTVRFHTNSEGTTIVDDHPLYSVQLQAWTRADDGMLLDNTASFYARSAEALPGEAELEDATDQLVEELRKLRRAPVIDPYTGPAILMPEASGVLFHEAVGHRLEGERMRDDTQGQTFKGQLGDRVIPTFLSIYDDPTRKKLGDQPLNGYYKFDDEGVPAERVTLIEDGTLKNYLKSRTPIEGSEKSNGHGRAQGTNNPMGRMANTIVEASDDKTFAMEKLKEKLIREVEKQDKPFGLIIQDITGGSTNTSSWGYQAFQGSPHLIYKVDPETGKTTLVRGAELVGTPLTSVNKILAAGEKRGVFNGYCGAESGYVPVSAIAPALLTSQIELQRTSQKKARPPVLSPPWRRDSGRSESAPDGGGADSADDSDQ